MKLKKITTYLFSTDENFSLERRLLISSLILGIFLGLTGTIGNIFLTTSIIASLVPFLLTIIAGTLYYFARYKNVYKSISVLTAVLGILGISVVWVFNGGINGPNIMLSLVILMLGLIIVPHKTKKYIITLYISVNIFILLIQIYRPYIIVDYPTESARQIDYLISLIYSSIFTFLIIQFIHKHYTNEKQRVEESEKNYLDLFENNPYSIWQEDLSEVLNILDIQKRVITTDLKEFLEKSPDFVMKCVKAVKIIKVNQATLDLFKFDTKEELMQNLESIFTEKSIQSFKKLLVVIANEEKQFSDETEYIKKTGEKIYAIIDFRKINDFRNVIFSISNITEHKQAELIINKQNEKLKKLNDDKDRFMQILGHDLKSPFNSLLGFSNLLLKNIHKYDIDKIESILKLINQASHSAYRLLEDLLLWSKSQSGKLTFEPQKIALSEICTEIIYDLKHQSDVKAISIKHIETEKTILLADLNMFKTILRNIISNAIKFTNEKGQIIIYSEINHTHATIVVSDNGLGIEKENIPKLWDFTEPYSTKGTADEKGSGFGLILCKEFVEKHGGKIWVDSQFGKGSDFKFTMPLYNE